MSDHLGVGALVTVLMPHYNCERWVERAIRSILGQSMERLALVVIDDGSAKRDALRTILDRCADPRLRGMAALRNVGPYQLINRVLPRIASPFVAFQDADDSSHPERLAIQLDALDRAGWDLLGTAVSRESESGAPLEPHYPHQDANRVLAWRCRGGVTFGATTICRTDFLRRLGGYDGSLRGKCGADTDLAYRAVFAGRVGNLPRPLYHVTVRGDSLTTSVDSGFASAARRAYRAEIRRRFYRNFWRSKLARLRPEDLLAVPNESDFALQAIGEAP